MRTSPPYRRSAIMRVTPSETTAGRLLREARRRAGLSQTELVARAGVTQSAISAYETGRRQPAVPALRTLIEATRHELILTLRQGPRPLAGLTGPVGHRVRRNHHALVAAAAARDVTGLQVFGSVARGTDRPDSDVDRLADLPPGMGLVDLARLEAELEDIVGVRVDLVPADGLKPHARRWVE
jgi:predicted nucleotidyltransferase/DNA-binding XRE family transcriptional regulator